MTTVGKITDREYELLCKELRERIKDCIDFSLILQSKEELENAYMEQRLSALFDIGFLGADVSQILARIRRTKDSEKNE